MNNVSGAVVGLGYWGPNVVRNLLKVSGVTLKKACDLSEKTLSIFHSTFPTIPITKDFNDICHDSSIDFIIIATPLITHYSLAKKALESNKHVLIEKPMTSTSKEAEILIDLAKKNKKILMVGHTFIYADAVQKMRKISLSQSLGRLLYYDSTRINLGRFQSDTNVIWDLAPHDFSILDFVIKEQPETIQVIGNSHYSKKTLESAHIFITYKSSFTAHIHVSWLSPVKIRNIIIAGSKQMILYDDIQPSEKIRIYNKSVHFDENSITPFAPAYRSGSISIPALHQTEPLFNQLEHFIKSIRKGTDPITSGKTGLHVVRLLEAAESSFTTGQPVILS